MDEEEMPQMVFKERDGYRTVNVNGVFGGPRPGFFEVIVFSEETDPTEAFGTAAIDPGQAVFRRTAEVRLVIDPYQAKSIAAWLSRNVEEYERMFGPITGPNGSHPREHDSADTMFR
ncbi:MAG: hypothetical protein QGG50_08490 [Methanopyri archaeon]|jgi:hypothetical protein|nr:hypothetical protein [Methanopyri archaeon]